MSQRIPGTEIGSTNELETDGVLRNVLVLPKLWDVDSYVRDSEDASESNYMRYSGSAYIFKQNSGGSNNWNMIKITASDRAGGDEFGTSVGISGDFAVVGANYEDENRLVGFNNRKYDNHMLWACMLGWTTEQLYALSNRIINEHTGFFGEAYNLSYTDIYDFSAKKQSLKKFEIELGIHHQELGLP